MTNPVDEGEEIESVDSAEDVADTADAVLIAEEEIPGDDESKPVRKKILALEARHKIEDYEIAKQMREALDYLDGKKPKKIHLSEKPKTFHQGSSHKKQTQIKQDKTPVKKTESVVLPPAVVKPKSPLKTNHKTKVTQQVKAKTQNNPKPKVHQHEPKAKNKKPTVVAKVKSSQKPKVSAKKTNQKSAQKSLHQKSVSGKAKKK